jgi:hypothetical protein
MDEREINGRAPMTQEKRRPQHRKFEKLHLGSIELPIARELPPQRESSAVQPELANSIGKIAARGSRHSFWQSP